MSEIKFEITDNTPKVKEELEDTIDLILEEWGLAGERFAKQNITVGVYNTTPSESYKRTGRLRGSITYATKKTHSSPEESATDRDGMTEKNVPDKNSTVIGTNVEYAAYVELGTSRMKARPYISPAVNQHTQDYEKIAKEYLSQH